MGSGSGKNKRIKVMPKALPPKERYKELEGIDKIIGAKISIGASLWDKHLIDSGLNKKTYYNNHYLGKNIKTEDATDKDISYIILELITDMVDSNCVYKPIDSGHYELLSDIEKTRLYSLLKTSSIKIEPGEKRYRQYSRDKEEVTGTNYILLSKDDEEIISCFQPDDKPLIISGKMYRELKTYKNITPYEIVRDLINPDYKRWAK